MNHPECANINCVCDTLDGWPYQVSDSYWVHMHAAKPKITKVEIPATEVRQPKKNTFNG